MTCIIGPQRYAKLFWW